MMFLGQALVLVTLWLALAGSYGAKLPASFERCKVSPELDDKPNECLARAWSDAILKLVDGSKELGVLPLEPLKINEMTIEQGGSSPVAIKLTFTDSAYTGANNAKVKEVSGKLSSPDGFHLKALLTTPAMTLAGSYEIAGRVLILPIEGVGQSKVTLSDADYQVDIKGEKQIKNGVEYLKVTSFKLKIIDPKGMKMHFGNLFKGDKALGDNTNRFLNENWKDIFQELKGAIENATGAVFEAYAKRVLERVPFKDIFITE